MEAISDIKKELNTTFRRTILRGKVPMVRQKVRCNRRGMTERCGPSSSLSLRADVRRKTIPFIIRFRSSVDKTNDTQTNNQQQSERL